MSFKFYLFGSLLIATAVLGTAQIAAAERIVRVRDYDSGVTFLVYLDDRTESIADVGKRQVSFWLSTTADAKKSRAIAFCKPYQVRSDTYDMYELSNGSGYSAGTVIGKIARLVCAK
jgi:hypothetical protein